MTTHSEMPRLAYLMIITRHRFSGGSETSLRLGRTATKTVGGVETVSYGYNIRSWPTRSESAKFTELMGYNTMLDGRRSMNPQFGGNISALSWKQGNSSYRGYELYYDDYGRLTDASYGEGLAFSSNGNRYDELFSYDRMGNITTLARNGKLDGSLLYGCIDDLEMEYDGNQLTRVYDNESDNDPTYEGAMQFTDNADEDVEYEYDANGNMTKDLNSNITSIQYNCLNLPSRVTVVSGGPSSLQYKVMDITYNADGEKLYVSPSLVMEIWPVLSPLQGGGAVQQQGGALPGGDPGPGTGTAPFDDPAIQDLSTRYCGNVVFERGEIARVLTDEGYITFAPNGKPMRHYYLRDHLGNIRVVFNQTGTVEQRNDYYPSGALMATSTGGSVQPYKYNGKELERMNGLDLYDYGARWMDSKIGARFTTIDPMCEKYYDISPYAYCAGNPVNCIDPDGRFVLSKEQAKKYPRLNLYLQKGIQGILDNPQIMHALRVAGRFTNDQIREMVTYGQGPTINVKPMEKGQYGSFLPNNNSSTLNISEDIVKELENAEGFDAVVSLFFIGVTILHEFSHYGDDLAGNPEEDREDGEVYENNAYGIVINKSNVRDYLLDYYKKKSSNNDDQKEKEEEENEQDKNKLP